MGNKMKARIDDIGTYKLILDIGCHVALKGCLYIPRCVNNLVFVVKLDALGFNFKIGNNEFSLFKDMYCYGSSTLIDGLYCFNLVAKFMKPLFNVECIVGMVVSVMCMVKVLLICGIKD